MDLYNDACLFFMAKTLALDYLPAFHPNSLVLYLPCLWAPSSSNVPFSVALTFTDGHKVAIQQNLLTHFPVQF